MNRKSIRIMALIMALVLAATSLLAVGGAAQESSASGRFSFLNYNIAGLPSLSLSSDKAARQKLLGGRIKEDDYDIVAVQEDFGYDSDFYSGLGAKYRTFGSQSVVTGDGLNIFSKTPLYDVYREGWNMKGGMLWEGDIVSQKGFMFAAVELCEGVYIDVYNLHADAFGGAESVQARHSNFTQVKEYIEKNSAGHAVIITGDFNSTFHFTNGEGADLYEIFVESLGMSDVWTDTVNFGSFTDYSSYSGDYWGNWDSVEHILYRSSDAVELTPVSHEYISYTDDDGNAISDHNAAAAEFEYTVSAKTEGYTLKPASRPFLSIIETAKVVIADLSYVFSHFDELITMLKYANDITYLYEHYSR
ncbi:MAG: endonuclease/exonuclease/phosphatase family protein [Clostridia bacterium]|nr:endonuclease/exonuclease/phosphatase family protein [Clostridia bacterium]